MRTLFVTKSILLLHITHLSMNIDQTKVNMLSRQSQIVDDGNTGCADDFWRATVT